jgi:hypothetical protein
MTKYEIAALPPCERIALYLELSARMAFIGAKLRKKEQWSDDDLDRWDEACGAVSACYFSLSEEEVEIIDPLDKFLSDLDKGNWPLSKIDAKETCFYCNASPEK